MSPTTPSIPCDSCGESASPEHIHDRILRLERSTRHRPIHISLLLICAVAPDRAEDDLYALEMEQGSPASRSYLTSLLECLGIDSAAFPTPAAQLAELQHRGTFLARMIECPQPRESSDADHAAHHAKTFLKRIALSYKPKRIALLNPVPPALTELLLNCQFAQQLIANGKGIQIPSASDARQIAAIRALFSDPNS